MNFGLQAFRDAARRWLAPVLGVLLAGGAGYLLYGNMGLGLAYQSYDFSVVAHGKMRVDEALILYLDEKSHKVMHQSSTAPWSRALHARMLDRLTAAGAKTVVFDVVFSDPNPDDPAADQALADAMRKNGHVVVAADPIVAGPGITSVAMPFELIRESAAAVGSDEVIPSRDLVVRQTPPMQDLPSLSWAAADLLGAKATRNQPAAEAPQWINFYGPSGTIPGLSYCDAFDPQITPDNVFRGKTIFIGARMKTKFAGDRKDEYRNPFSQWVTADELKSDERALFIPGVEIQATAFLNLLRGDGLSRMPPLLEQFICAATGMSFGFGLLRVRPSRAILLAMGGIAITMLMAYLLMTSYRIWFVWLIVVTQIGLALAWAISYNSVQLYVQKRIAEHTLGLYLSPKLVRKFASDPALLKPGAVKHELTLFFSDIADFTSITEGLDSDELARLMNEYFETAVTHCVHKTDGTVVKYIGDAIFCFWNAPELQPDHAARACEAVLRFRDLDAHSINGVKLHTRIGLHTGQANVGNFGSAERVDYTALGENVNLASRLEGLNKHLGTTALLSGATKAEICDRFVTREVGQFRLKGFERAVSVYELLGWPKEAEQSREWRELFAQALEAFRKGNSAAARAGFEGVLKLRGEDGPSRFYLARLRELESEPLPPQWAGVVELKEK